MSPQKDDLHTITLSSFEFQGAISLYLEQTKPDALVKRQINSLSFLWREEMENTNGNFTCSTKSSSSLDNGKDNSFPISNAEYHNNMINGELSITGNYGTVFLQANCEWSSSKIKTQRNTHKSQNQHPTHDNVLEMMPMLERKLKFTLSASATLAKSINAIDNNIDNKLSRREKKAMNHSRSKIIERIKKDEIIAKLLASTTDNHHHREIDKKCSEHKMKKEKNFTASCNTDAIILNNSSSNICICEVILHHTTPLKNEEFHSVDNHLITLYNNSATATKALSDQIQIEEKVRISDDGLEAIRRLVLSHYESNISVMELLLSLPWLPRSLKGICPLGERAILRILEEVTMEACEKEEDVDEMLDELDLEDDGDNAEENISRSNRKRMKQN